MIQVLLVAVFLVTSATSTRLSQDVVPSKQLLHFKFDFKKWRYAGRTEIQIEVKKKRDNIWLYADTEHFKISGISLENRGGQAQKIAKATTDKKKKILYLKLQKPIKPGQYKLKIRLSGKVREALQGMIKTGYVDRHGHKHYQVTTHFEPDKAREAFPCFDEPAFRVRIKLIVEHPASHRTNSAGRVKSRKSIGSGRVRTEFEETDSISVYLLAINIHDMGSVSVKSTRGVPVTVLTPDYSRKEALRTARLAARALEWYEKYLGINYPFKKLDLIGIFDFNAGGMENIAMIHLMYDCVYSADYAVTPKTQLFCHSVIVHEVSHMWFGNMVSLKWWDDLWLKEGFARFITQYASDHMGLTDRPPGAYELGLAKRGYAAGTRDDKFKFTKPVRQTLKDSYAAAAMFNNLSYAKGSWILRAVQKLIGEKNFQKGLQKYFKTYQMKSANFNDFTGCFDKITDKVSVREFMENWLNEPGFPMVKINKDNSRTISMTQGRYTPDGNYHTNQVWIIPINFQSNAEAPTKYTLWDTKKAYHSYSRPFKWYVHDTLSTEFAFFKYDENNMRLIAQELRKNPKVLSDMQRTIYTYNLLENYRNNRIKAATFLETSRYLPKEWQGHILERWLVNLLHFRHQLYLPENKHLFWKYFKHVLIHRVRVAMRNEIEDTKCWNIKKYYKWMFYFGVRWRVPSARARAKRIIRKFFAGKHVNIVYLSFVLRIYYRVRHSFAKIYRLLSWYPRSIKEYSVILAYVCKTHNARQQLFILNFSKKSQMMPRSLKKRTICYVSNRNADLTWRWFKKNYGYYFTMYGQSQFSMNSLLDCVTGNLKTPSQYRDVKRFFTKNSAGTGSAGLKRGMDSIRENMAARRSRKSQSRREDYDEIFAKFIRSLKDGELEH